MDLECVRSRWKEGSQETSVWLQVELYNTLRLCGIMAKQLNELFAFQKLVILAYASQRFRRVFNQHSLHFEVSLCIRCLSIPLYDKIYWTGVSSFQV